MILSSVYFHTKAKGQFLPFFFFVQLLNLCWCSVISTSGELSDFYQENSPYLLHLGGGARKRHHFEVPMLAEDLGNQDCQDWKFLMLYSPDRLCTHHNLSLQGGVSLFSDLKWLGLHCGARKIKDLA